MKDLDNFLLLLLGRRKKGYSFLNSSLFIKCSTFEKILKVTEMERKDFSSNNASFLDSLP